MCKVLYIIFFLLISSMSFSAESWKAFIFPGDGYNFSISTSRLSLKDVNGKLEGPFWAGETIPYLKVIQPRSDNRGYKYLFGDASLQTFEYTYAVIKEFYVGKKNLSECILNQNGNSIHGKFIVSLIEKAGETNPESAVEIPKVCYFAIAEMVIGDISKLNKAKDEDAYFSGLIISSLNKYSKEFIEISCGDGVVALRDGMLSLRKKNADGGFSVISQAPIDGTELMAAYLKANGGQALLEGTGKVTINKGFGNEDKGLSYLLKTRVLWNYFVRAVLMQKPEADKAFIAEIAAEDVKQGDLEIPATFPENLKTPEAAKALALAAYNKKYEALKTQDGASLPQPEKFIYKIVKLNSTVDKFAPEGTALWQVDMFDAASNLICSAWINPENASEALSQINPQTIFPLEPIEAIALQEIKSDKILK